MFPLTSNMVIILEWKTEDVYSTQKNHSFLGIWCRKVGSSYKIRVITASSLSVFRGPWSPALVSFFKESKRKIISYHTGSKKKTILLSLYRRPFLRFLSKCRFSVFSSVQSIQEIPQDKDAEKKWIFKWKGFFPRRKTNFSSMFCVTLAMSWAFFVSMKHWKCAKHETEGKNRQA